MLIESDYLELAVALAVVFFVAALAVSGVNEGISWLTRVRAKFLWAYLHDLFGPRADGGSDRALPSGMLGITRLWTSARDKRPAAGGAVHEVVGQDVDTAAWLDRVAYALDPVDAPGLTHRPAAPPRTTIKNVPPASLAQAVLEAFADVGRQEITAAVRVATNSQASDDDVAAALEVLTKRLQLPPRVDVSALTKRFREALVALEPGDDEAARFEAADALSRALLGPVVNARVTASWRAVAVQWPGVEVATVDEAVSALATVYPEHFARLRIEAAMTKLAVGAPIAPSVRRVWEAAAGRIDEFRSGLERFFDAEMSRLSGYYRRSIRVVMISVALLFTFASGFDAIAMTRDLWRSPDDRAALLARADELLAANAVPGTVDPTTAAPGTLERIQAQCVAARAEEGEVIASVDDAAAAFGEVRSCVSDALNELTSVSVLDDALWVDADGWSDRWSAAPLQHAIGTIIAALALSLGAPFWFDVIKRATGIRRGIVGDT